MDVFWCSTIANVRCMSSTFPNSTRAHWRVAGKPIFPAAMPPFVGRDALQIAPDGRLWVARTKNVAQPVHTYDVFDAAGRLTRRAELPPHRRLVGFGAREVSAVHRDADDLERLERYRY